jgi:hypothetical protein
MEKFNPENWGDMFLLNVAWHSTGYMALYPIYKFHTHLFICCFSLSNFWEVMISLLHTYFELLIRSVG